MADAVADAISDAEAAFQRFLKSSEPYFSAVKAAGDEPWFDSPEKLAKLEDRCPGISGLRGEEARRSLFMTNKKETP